MNHNGADERSELRAVVRDFLTTTWSRDELRHGLDGIEPKTEVLWTRFAGELGLAGLLLPEECGGAAGSMTHAGVVLEELGRSLAPLPFLSGSVVAATALHAAGADPALLEALAAGTRRAAFVSLWADPPAPLDTQETDDGLRVSGQAGPALDGGGADLFLLFLDHSGTTVLAAVEAGAQGVTVEAIAGLDSSLPLSVIHFDGAPATVLASDAGPILRRVLAIARTGLAASLLGTARGAFERTVAQSLERSQFGRLIGSYQAIKHRIADMMIDVETTASAVSWAIEAIESDAPDLADAADLALTWATEKTRRVVGEMIQLHGGMGYTWEHDAHLYYRRAYAAGTLLGSGDASRDRAWAGIASTSLSESPGEPNKSIGEPNESTTEVARVVHDFIDRCWDPTLTVREWWQRAADERLTLPSLPPERVDAGGPRPTKGPWPRR